MNESRNDKFAIFQFPNKFLWTMIAAWLVSLFAHGTLQAASRTIFIAAAIIWSYEEITSGVNLFRRVLGAVVMFLTVVGIFHLIF